MCFDDFEFDDDYRKMLSWMNVITLIWKVTYRLIRLTRRHKPPEPSFDLENAFILGGMIAGQTYEEAVEKKEQGKKKKQEEKKEVIGHNSSYFQIRLTASWD